MISIPQQVKKWALIVVMFAYYAVLIKIIVFKDIPTIRIGSIRFNFSGVEIGHPPNFIPFKTILSYLLGHKGFIIAGINLIGNIVLLIPIGFLASMVYREMTWKKSIALSVATALSLELLQAFLNVGIFDIDDVILNGLGVMIGYWGYGYINKQ